MHFNVQMLCHPVIVMKQPLIRQSTFLLPHGLWSKIEEVAVPDERAELK